MADYHLTPPERAVVWLLAHGLTAGEAAQELSMAESTVLAHLRNIRKRWETRTTPGIVGLAYRSGAIFAEPDEVAAEDTWTTKVREAGFEIARWPEFMGDQRHESTQRRGEDR